MHRPALRNREGQFGREARQSRYPPGDVERRRAGHRVGIARRQQKRRCDAHGAADSARIETAQAGSCSGRRQQRHLTVLVRQRPGSEPTGKSRGDIVTEDKGRQQLAAGAPRVLAHRQDARQDLHRRLA